MEEIIQEKISADHLLYVSLKYTKTCDVIMNLLLRWRKMIETCNGALLQKAVDNKKIAQIPDNAISRINEMRKIYKKEKNILDALDFYMMLRKLDQLKTERIGEFRKNVNLKIFFRGQEINVNLEQLKIYAELLENFVDFTKKTLKGK